MPDITPPNTPSNAVTWDMITNSMPMTNSPTQVPSEAQVYQADQLIIGMMGKIQTAAGIEYGAWAYPFTATTNSSGVATVYLTSDGTNAGTVAFPNKVYSTSATPVGVGAANYNATSIVVSPDRKTLTVTLNQIKTVLGLLSFNATADAGVVVQGTVWGK